MKWIKTKDELPEEGSHVQCFCPTFCPTGQMTGVFELGRFNLEGYGDGTKYVTHWMPLFDEPAQL